MADDSTEAKIVQENRTLMALYDQHQRQIIEELSQLRDSLTAAIQEHRDSTALMDSRIAALEQIRLDLTKVSQALVLFYQKLLTMFRVKAD